MSDYMSEIDKILDENCDENVVLYDDNDKETEFEQSAVIPKEDKIYVILKPVTEFAGVEENEALLFVIDEIEGEDCLVIVSEENVIDEVFEIYYKLYADALGESD